MRWFVVTLCMLGLAFETIGLAALVEQSHRQAMMTAAADDGEAMSCHDEGAMEEESEGDAPEPAAFVPVHECCVKTRCPCCKRAHVAPTLRLARFAAEVAQTQIHAVDVIAYSAHSLHDVFLNTLDRPPKHA